MAHRHTHTARRPKTSATIVGVSLLFLFAILMIAASFGSSIADITAGARGLPDTLTAAKPGPGADIRKFPALVRLSNASPAETGGKSPRTSAACNGAPFYYGLESIPIAPAEIPGRIQVAEAVVRDLRNNLPLIHQKTADAIAIPIDSMIARARNDFAAPRYVDATLESLPVCARGRGSPAECVLVSSSTVSMPADRSSPAIPAELPCILCVGRVRTRGRDQSAGPWWRSIIIIARMSAIILLGLCLGAIADLHTWKSATAGNASVAGNWNTGVPSAGDSVVFSNTGVGNCTWNLKLDSLRAWNQTSNYTGWVTCTTSYAGTFDTLKINGDMLINGGTLSQKLNTTAQTSHLCVRVSGNLTVGASGAINVDTCGYNIQTGPGFSTYAAAHGGMGGAYETATSATYGSLTAPVTIGSGGNGDNNTNTKGGGAVLLRVGGTLTISGSISADGHWGLSSGAGGSIYIQAAGITGGGTIHANGGLSRNNTNDDNFDWPTGGGGRISIVISGVGNDFSGLTNTPTAYPGQCQYASRAGAAGTVYMEKQADGSGKGNLIIDNNSSYVRGETSVYTTIPSGDSWSVGTVTIKNGAHFKIPSGTTFATTGTGTTITVNAAGDSLTNEGTLSIGGTGITVNGVFTRNATTSTVTYTGQTNDAAVTIYPTGTYYSLTVNNAGTTFNQAGATTVTHDLNITSGTYDFNSQSFTATGATVTNNDTIQLAGGETVTNFTPSTTVGTISYDGAATGLKLGNAYFSLAIKSSGTYTLNAALDCNGNLGVLSGTLAAAGYQINVAGNWSNAATFTHGNNTVVLDGTGKTISGSTTFYKLKKIVAAADSLFFTNGTTQTVSDSCVLKGASGQLLKLRSTSPGNQWSLNPAASKRDIQYVDVKDGNNTNATIISPANSTNSGNNTNWFAAVVKIWVAASDGLASADGNWSPAAKPVAGDSIVFILASSNKNCTWDLTLDSLRAWNQTATYGGTVSAGAVPLTVSGDVTIAGGTLSHTTGNFACGGSWTNGATYTAGTNTVTFYGTASGKTITAGASSFNNVSIAGSGGVWTLATNNMTVAGNLRITAGTLDPSANTKDLTVTGNLTIAGGTLTATNTNLNVDGNDTLNTTGTLTAPGSSKNFTIAGNCILLSGSTFTNSSGAITLDGTASGKYLRNSNAANIYNLAVAGSGGVWTVTSDANLTVANNLRITAGTLDPSANTKDLTVTGNLTIAGGTLTATNTNLNVDGNDTLNTTGTLTAPGSSKNFTIAGNCILLSGSTFTNSSGTLTLDGGASGKYLRNSNAANIYNLTVAGSGGVWTVTSDANLTVANNLRITAGTLDPSANTKDLTVTGNLTIAGGTLTATNTNIDVNGDDTLNTTGTLTAPGASKNFTVAGNCILLSGSTFTNSSGAITLDGTASGKYLRNSNATNLNKLRISGSGGAWTITSDANLTVADSISILAGSLTQTSTNVSAATYYVASGATFSNASTGDITVGAGGVSNAGTISLDGNGGGCGGADDILIRSSSSPTQRSWSGAGTFLMYDIDAMDQAGSASIYAYSSTGAAQNNGANWTFGACPVDSTGFRTLTTVRKTGSTTDTCLVYTRAWSMVFREATGGGIAFLKDSTWGNAAGNQMPANRNLFAVAYDGDTSSKSTVSGADTLLEATPACVRVRQTVTLATKPFTIDYTVNGAGNLFVRVSVDGAISSKALAFLVTRSNMGTIRIRPKTAIARSCPSILLADDNPNNRALDLLFAQYDTFPDVSPAWAFDTNSNVGATSASLAGWKNTYSQGTSSRGVWEFMVNFGRRLLNDTSSTTTALVNDYRNPDSLEIISGSLTMEKAWESYLEGHWRMDDGNAGAAANSGDSIRDNSGLSRHGRIYCDDDSWIAGRWGTALQLDGDDSAVVPTNAGFGGAQDMTLMAWVNPAATLGSSNLIFQKGDQAAGTIKGYKLTGNGSGQPVFTIGDGSAQIAVTGHTALGTGAWRHVAVVSRNYLNLITIYVDGKPDTLSTTAFNADTNYRSVKIGNALNGAIDDVRFYSTALGDDDVKAIYQKGFRSSMGRYSLRADNNNTMHFYLDGGTYPRYYPVFHMANYYASTGTPIVYLGSTRLTNSAADTSYIVGWDGNQRELTVALDTVLSANSVKIYIDDGNDSTPVWQTGPVATGYRWVGNDSIVVKNFSGSSFSTSGSNQWAVMIDRKVGAGADSLSGGIKYYGTSETNPSKSWYDKTNGTIVYDNSSSVNPDYGPSSMTWSHTIGAGSNRMLVVGVAAQDGYGISCFRVTGVTYNGKSLTFLDSTTAPSTPYVHSEMWYLLESDLPASGAADVVVTLAGGTDRPCAGAISLKNVKQAAPEVKNKKSVNAAAINTSLTPLTDGSWVVDVGVFKQTTGITPTKTASGQVQRWYIENETAGGGSTDSTAAAGSLDTVGWSNGVTDYRSQIVACIAPAAGNVLVASSSEMNFVKWRYASGSHPYDSSYGGKIVSGSNLSVTADTNSVFSQYTLGSVKVRTTAGTDSMAFTRKYTIYPQGKIFTLFSASAASSIDSMMPGLALARNVSGSDSLISYWGSADKRIGGYYDTAATRGKNHGVAFGYLSYQRGSVKGPSASTLVDASASWMNVGGEKKLVLQDSSTRYKTDSVPYRLALYYDISRDFRSTAQIDSVIKDALYTNCISVVSGYGKKDSTTSGDLDSNGYNEAEGYWAVQAATDPPNTVKFKLDVDANVKVHYYPAFKITNYRSSDKPQYVFMADSLNQDANTARRLTEGYGYTAYLNRSSNYLMVQLDTVIRNDSAYIFLSSDRTLAVTTDVFSAFAGDNCDTLVWRTESEKENLGFLVYRRIKPEFWDSLSKRMDAAPAPSGDEDEDAITLAKKQAVTAVDTNWVPAFQRMIPGVTGGTSAGPRHYRYVDRGVRNNLLYQYKLVAVDYSQKQDEYGKRAEVMPGLILPRVYKLWANYPNPFRTFTTIRFDLPKKCRVTMNVYSLQGRLVRTLVNGTKKAGFYRVVWNGTDDWNRKLTSGPYVCQIMAGEYRKARVMIYVR